MAENEGVLERADAPVAPADAERLLRNTFGIDGKVKRLPGERDQNFLVTASTGERSVLKISNTAENPAVTNLQTGILRHLAEADPGLPVPRLKSTVFGEPEFLWDRNGSPSVVRLLSFVAGRPAGETLLQPADIERLGAVIARVDLALRDFSHPSDGHELLWDLQHTQRLTELLPAIADPSRRELAERGLRALSSAVAQCNPLRMQVIHNDLNRDNILMSAERPPQVSGLLDFGDAVRAPLVNELGIAAAYHIADHPDPLARVGALVRGYVSVLPLADEELELIVPLIIGRLAMTVVITSWRAERHPANSAYILRNAGVALAGLSRLMGPGPERLEDELRSIVGRAGA